MSSDEEASKAARKRRTQYACDFCKRRKIKCDSAKMPDNQCTTCIGMQKKCQHTLPQKKRGPKNSYVAELEEKIRIMSDLLQSVDVSNNPIQADFETSTDSAQTGTDTISRSSHVLSPVLPTMAALSKPDGEEIYNHVVPDMISSKSLEQRFFGASSGIHLVKDTYELKMGVTKGPKFPEFALSRRPEFWNIQPWEKASKEQRIPEYSFPEPPSLLFSLVSLYFDNTGHLFPILHAPTFKRSIIEGLHYRDHQFGATVLLVSAIGSRYSTDPRVLHNPESELSCGWQWFEQVQLIRRSLFDLPSLYELQYYCLAILYNLGTSSPAAAWTLVSVGIRFSQELGIHRRKAEGHRWTAEEEQKKRAFWVLVTLDRLTASFLGRSSAICDEDFDVELPIECDDEYWDTPNSELVFVQPPNKPSILTGFVCYLRLCEILAFALRTLYSTKKSRLLFGLVGENWRQKTVAELDSAMNEWVNSLPEHLRSDSATQGQGIFAQQSAFLHSSFSSLQILIHQTQIHRPHSLPALPSLVICMTAARLCARVLECQKNTGVTSLPHTQYSAFVACATLLSVDSGRDLANIEKLISILQTQESRWAGAGRFCDLLTELRVRKGHNLPLAQDLNVSSADHAYNDYESQHIGPLDPIHSTDENIEILLQGIFGTEIDNGTLPFSSAYQDRQLLYDQGVPGAAPSTFNYYEWVG